MKSSSALRKEASLEAGDKAPDFTMPTHGGGSVSLDSLKGRNVVLYFYPKDDTPGCTIEARDFAATEDAFRQLNTVIIGVSKDDVKSHDRFREKYCLPFTLASDNADVCESYGTWVEKNMYGKKYMGISRDTFLIDASGTIRKIWRKVKVEGHVSEVLTTVKAL
jgi:peroxiredoxin Q/BCP